MNHREEMCMDYRNEGKIPFTIEMQLKSYAEHPVHTERHEILWHEWKHNKRWLSQVQELILSSMPSYSKHDVTHSESVLHNIELVLGEKNIRDLSPTDCFVLLHTVYVHDIGMCITYEDRRKMIESKDFIRFLKQLVKSHDEGISRYASLLLDTVENSKQEHELLEDKLDIYYAILYLMSDYHRQRHGEISRSRLISWIGNPEKLGVGFSTMDIPHRIFHLIGNIAGTHTESIETVLSLNKEDTGFAHDYVHPCFLAVLLQLGDALDMDNGRFHPITKEYLGPLPSSSEIHFRKHEAITHLYIANEKIYIEADCQRQEELRLIRSECAWIRHLLEKTAYCWSYIRPRGSNVTLPSFKNPRLLFNGKDIPESLIEAHFQISQKRAFELLKGNNIYRDKYVFLRELIQNAVDATKIQFFRDAVNRGKLKKEACDCSPADMAKVMHPDEYPIEVILEIGKGKNGNCRPISTEDIVTYNENDMDDEYGVIIEVRDYGTGISAEDVNQIESVGSSYESRRIEIEQMPQWLQPTGLFGIGLQSVFLVASKFTAITHTRKGESYDITFYPIQEGKDGYINVTPVLDGAERHPYGTCFRMFVSNGKIKVKDQKEDIFDPDYVKKRGIKDARLMMKDMEEYLSSLFVNPLFPLSLEIRDIEIQSLESEQGKKLFKFYEQGFVDRFHGISLQIPTYQNGKWCKEETRENKAQMLWAYDLDRREALYCNKKGGECYLDVKEGRLYIWESEYNAYAMLGISRLLRMEKQLNNKKRSMEPVGMDVYYKGLKAARRAPQFSKR